MYFQKSSFLKLTLSLGLIASFSFNSCKHEPDLAGIPAISFSNDIKVILSGNCSMTACHASDAQSEFPLITYNDVMEHGEIRAGNAKGSKLYEAIIDEGEDKMPPTGPLTDLQIKKIYIWIEQGALDN